MLKTVSASPFLDPEKVEHDALRAVLELVEQYPVDAAEYLDGLIRRQTSLSLLMKVATELGKRVVLGVDSTPPRRVHPVSITVEFTPEKEAEHARQRAEVDRMLPEVMEESRALARRFHAIDEQVAESLANPSKTEFTNYDLATFAAADVTLMNLNAAVCRLNKTLTMRVTA